MHGRELWKSVHQELRSLSPTPASALGSAPDGSAAASLGTLVASSSTAPSSPPLARSPFSMVSGQKAAPPARQGPQEHSRFGTVKPRGSRSPLGERFTLRRPSGHGVRVPEPAGLAAPARCRGTRALPPTHKPFSWGGRRGFGGAGAASAKAQG